MKELYIGLISGTSMDAVDAVLVELSNEQLQLIGCHNEPVPASIQQQIKAIYASGMTSLVDLGMLDAAIGSLFAQAAQSLLQHCQTKPEQVRAIGSHGQTIWHHPIGQQAFSMQIGDANRIAAITNIATVADFRRKDMALGGQGAPLVPAFHEWLFRSKDEDRAILNLGGIANLTCLPANKEAAISGFDTGPSNCLLDEWCSLHQHQPYDANGNWARSGTLNQTLLELCLEDPYFYIPPPKSTGREFFHQQWLASKMIKVAPALTPKDVQRTLIEVTSHSVAHALQRWAPTTKSLFACGGGVHNQCLMESIQAQLPNVRVDTTAALGLDVDYVEACCFAWLAKQRLEGKSVDLASVTGARRNAILGGLYLAG